MLKVDTVCMETQAMQMKRISDQLNDISSRVADVNRTLRWNTSINTAVRGSLASNSRWIAALDNKASSLAEGLGSAVVQYKRAEGTANSGVGTNQSTKEQIQSEKEYEISQWADVFKFGTKVSLLMYKLLSTLKGYIRFGNIVGTRNAIARWLLNAADLKGLSGHWSTAKNPITAFFRNFTNSKSPIRGFFKDMGDDLIGKKGIGNAVASWLDIVLNYVESGAKNWEEYHAADGEISVGRAVGETVLEGTVDTVASYAIGAALTAAVAAGAAAAGATVAVPALALTVVGGLVWSCVNGATEKATEKSVTEHISDWFFDAFEPELENVQKTTGSKGTWFGQLALS